MPFDYVQYQQKVNTLSSEQLHKEWENYTRQIAGGATSTATSVLFSPVTGGVSLIGLGLSAPRIHNARKKREIIEAGLQLRGETHNTRKRDVVAPMAVAGVISGLTLGLAAPGAEMLGAEAGAKGMEYVVAHAALDGTGAILEQKHDDHTKKKGEAKLRQQQQNFQNQYALGPTVQPQTLGYQPMVMGTQNLIHLPGVPAPPGMVAMMVQPGQNPMQYQQPLMPPLAQSQIVTPQATPNAAPLFPQCSSQLDFGQQNPTNQASMQPAPPYQNFNQQPIHQQPQPTQSIAGSFVGAVAAYPSEKPGQTYIGHPEGHGYPPAFSEPLPVYSPLMSSMPLSSQNEKPPDPSVQDIKITLNELPAESIAGKSAEGMSSAESAMDQEITILKARLLQMELEKRGMSLPNNPVVETPYQPTHTPMSPQLTVGLGCSDHEASRAATPLPPAPTPVQTSLSPPPTAALNFAPSPLSTPPPLYNDALQAGQASQPHQYQSSPPQPPGPPPQLSPEQRVVPSPPPGPPTHNSQQQHMTPPPPQGPPPQSQPETSFPASQVQNYTTPISQQVQPQQQIYTSAQPLKPDYHRNDSGYYSQPHSRATSTSSIPQYAPSLSSQYPSSPQTPVPSLLSPISPQSTATSLYNPSQHRYSISSQPIYTPSSTPASSLYFPPPPGTTNLPAVHPVGKQDYFGQARISTPQPPFYQPQPQMGQPQQVQGQSMQPQMVGYAQPPQPQVQQQQLHGSQGWQWGTAQAPQQQYSNGQPVQQVPMQNTYPMQQQAWGL